MQRIRRRIEDTLVGFGYSEAYTLEPVARGPRTGGDPAAGAAVERAGRSPDVPRRRLAGLCAPKRRRRQRTTSLSSNWRTSISRRTTGFPTNAGISVASRRAASPSRKAPSKGSTPLSGSSRRSDAAADLPAPGRGARTGEGWVGGAARPRAAWRVGSVRARRRRSSPSCVPEPGRVRRRHHVSPRPPGPRLRRSRRSDRGRPRRCREGSRRPGAPGDARLRRLPGRAGRARKEVDRLLRHVPVARRGP